MLFEYHLLNKKILIKGCSEKEAIQMRIAGETLRDVVELHPRGIFKITSIESDKIILKEFKPPKGYIEKYRNNK